MEIRHRGETEAFGGGLLGRLLGPGSIDVVVALERRVPLLKAADPMVTAQVVRDLRGRGVIDGYGPTLVIDHAALRAYAPPASIADAVERLIGELGGTTRRVLAVAALLGRRFEAEALSSVTRFEPVLVEAALEDGRRRGLIWQDADGWCFSHSAVCAALADSIGSERDKLHGRIAIYLRREGASQVALARHFDAAGDDLAAVAAYNRAGAEALAAGELRAARGYHRHAVAIARGRLAPSRRRDELLVDATFETVRLSARLGEQELAEIVDTCGSDLGPRAGELDAAILSVARACALEAEGAIRQAGERARIYLDAEVPHSGVPQLVALRIAGRAAVLTGRFADGARMLGWASELAERADDPWELCRTLASLATACGFVGDHRRARTTIARAVEIARDLADAPGLLEVLAQGTAVGEAALDWAGGSACAARADELRARTGIGGIDALLVEVMAARHLFHRGDLVAAEERLLDAIDEARDHGVVTCVGWAYGYLGDLRFAAGRYREAEDSYRRALAVGDGPAADDYAAALGLIGLAHVAAVRGKGRDRVGALADQALERLAATGNRRTTVDVLERYAACMQILGDSIEAELLDHDRAELIVDLDLPASSWLPKEEQSPRAPSVSDAETTLVRPVPGLLRLRMA